MRLAILGAGKMAAALVRGLLGKGYCGPEEIIVSSRSRERLFEFSQGLGVSAAESNQEAVEGADAVLVCVKPCDVGQALAQCGDGLSERLVMSVAAGVRLEDLVRFGAGKRVIRAMPNVAASIGRSVTAMACGEFVSAEDVGTGVEVFESVGSVVVVKEGWMEALTGLCGSGPAFVCLFVEALSDGAVAAGVGRDLATRLAMEMVAGSGEWMMTAGKHLAELREEVTSPGGTTIAGLMHLEGKAVRAAIAGAVVEAARRAQDLSIGGGGSG